jgi:hypothetical protein
MSKVSDRVVRYVITAPLSKVQEIDQIVEAWGLEVVNVELMNPRTKRQFTGKIVANGKAKKPYVVKGTHQRGVPLPDAKIIKIFKARGTGNEIALRFGVTQSTVSRIKRVAGERLQKVLAEATKKQEETAPA